MFVLDCGYHKTREEGMCLMELVAYLAGEEHTDLPQCSDPLISMAAQEMNDFLWHDERQRLIPLAWEIIGTQCDECNDARHDKAWELAHSMLSERVDYFIKEETRDLMRKALQMTRDEFVDYSANVSTDNMVFGMLCSVAEAGSTSGRALGFLTRSVYGETQMADRCIDMLRQLIAVCPHNDEWSDMVLDDLLVVSY